MIGAPNTVNAAPTKSFFVSMLTRDIQLEDAILDLLDNCVDGILRSGVKEDPEPYGDHKAKIEFDAKSFSISDNCGGIPWEMHDYAFRMGRPTKGVIKEPRSVGVYGIGMKRAIFKIGKHCTISTRSAKQYEIEITPAWMGEEDGDDVWRIPVRGPVEPEGSPGTTIVVRDLNKGIAEMFDKGKNRKSFSSKLRKTISTHYAHMIAKGFEVTINGEAVEPTTVRIAFDREWEQRDDAVMPFVFEGEADGVEVYLAVGLTGRIPSKGRAGRKRAGATRPTSDPGWTVVCNDRIVLYCDRTELTGWGESIVPKYHTQFASIAGIVEFRSEDPSKLPTMTTKTGVDASSSTYRQVKRKMLEGTRIFVDYTNKWKGKEGKTADHIDRCELLSLDELKSKSLRFEVAHALPQSRQCKPALPVPSEPSERQITFRKDARKIEAVSERLFGNPDTSPSRVGSRCFDLIYDETLR